MAIALLCYLDLMMRMFAFVDLLVQCLCIRVVPLALIAVPIG